MKDDLYTIPLSEHIRRLRLEKPKKRILKYKLLPVAGLRGLLFITVSFRELEDILLGI